MNVRNLFGFVICYLYRSILPWQVLESKHMLPSFFIQDLATYFVYATNVALHATSLNKHPSSK